MATALMAQPAPAPSAWELAAEAIAVKIRWFGLLVGYLLVNLGEPTPRQVLLNAILSLGAAYTLFDTWFSLRGRVFLGRYPLLIAVMEALFIGLLCYHDGGLDSPFRYYYFLSLICCAIRYPSAVTYLCCASHCLSYGLLYLALPAQARRMPQLALMLVMLAWVTWASDAMALLLKRVGDYLGHLNSVLTASKAELEARIAERTRQLQQSQAHVLHQEKMAAFGLLAAGIAHEVGNPLTSISSLVQVLQHRENDAYTQGKLALVSGQLQRIRTTLRELVQFSRPATSERSRISLADVLSEAINIAKYYKRTRDRISPLTVPTDLPPLVGVRDQLVQIFLNLVLNAIDAIDRNGRIDLEVVHAGPGVLVSVRDNGCGMPAASRDRVFQPYFTTKPHGTGLGLFVTRKLVEDHGGRIDFETTAGGETVFRVFLPLTATGSSSSAAARPVEACP